MPVNLSAPVSADLFPVRGVRIGVVEAGVRKANRKDLTVFVLVPGSTVAGVFTKNRFCAAPVQVCQTHLSSGMEIRALLVNTGNANAGTGAEGLERTLQSCRAMAAQLNVEPVQVLPFSTGVIMEPLPVERIEAAIPHALSKLSEDNWSFAAEGIMTTDTLPKAFSERVELNGTVVTVTGISKGAGMIRPNMATMLGFLATDASIAPELLPVMVRKLADLSFNQITIDGDTSTNDSFVLIATHQAEHKQITSLDSVDGAKLMAAMLRVSQKLAQAIVRDGEGATKFINVLVSGGKNSTECKKVAYAIAHSPLVKTAFMRVILISGEFWLL